MIKKYPKIINLLDIKLNQPTTFRTINNVEINDESQGTYNKDNQVKFKTSVLRLSLCDYSDGNILVKEAITVAKETDAAPNNVNEKIIFKHCAPFTNCISRINNTKIDDTQ